MDSLPSPMVRPLTIRCPSSPPPLPATAFPTPLPPPFNLPFRLPPLLDATSTASHLLDDAEDENRNLDAWNTLARHRQDRMPLVINTSERLHAVLGLKNEQPFHLPQTPSSVLARRASLPPAQRALYDMSGVASSGLGLGISLDGARGVKRNLDGTGPKATALSVDMEVDKETGRGLLDYLLLKGQEGGMQKNVSCQSLEFYDFTPDDLRTSKPRNVLLSGYDKEIGERVDFYEVELPATYTDPDTGAVIQTTETWIWFYLSRPMFNPYTLNREIRTPPQHPINPTSPKSGNTEFFTPPTSTHPTSRPQPQPTPQPNLPNPAPTSWLVFALPKAHCTTYPTRTEEPFLSHFLKQTASRVNKRTDFDLSHSGLPIFEFSPKNTRKELSTWYAYIDSLHQTLHAPPNASGKEVDGVNAEIELLNRVYEDGIKGHWLSVAGHLGRSGPFDFNGGLVGEVRQWQEVREAMGRGKLRVVMRWTESLLRDVDLDVEVAAMLNGDFEMGGMDMEEAGRGRLGSGPAPGAKTMMLTSNILMGIGRPTRTIDWTAAAMEMGGDGGVQTGIGGSTSGLAEVVRREEEDAEGAEGGVGLGSKSAEKRKQVQGKKNGKGRKR